MDWKRGRLVVALIVTFMVALACTIDPDDNVVVVADTSVDQSASGDTGATDTGSADTAADTGSADTATDSGDAQEGDEEPVEDTCGDGNRDPDEQCDLGEDQNGPDSNCSAECTRNPVQRFVVGASDISDWEYIGDPHAAPTNAWAQEGSGCWANEAGEKFQIYLDFEAAAMEHFGEFTIDDIQRITYYSRVPSLNSFNFYALLYTEQDRVDDTGLFYGYRLCSLPVYARDPQAEVDTWTFWSTDEGPNQLPFLDHAKQPTWDTYDQSPSLQELQASDAFDWSSLSGGDATAIDYGSEVVRYFGIHADGDWAEVGCLDSVTIELTDGRSLFFDLEE